MHLTTPPNHEESTARSVLFCEKVKHIMLSNPGQPVTAFGTFLVINNQLVHAELVGDISQANTVLAQMFNSTAETLKPAFN